MYIYIYISYIIYIYIICIYIYIYIYKEHAENTLGNGPGLSSFSPETEGAARPCSLSGEVTGGPLSVPQRRTEVHNVFGTCKFLALRNKVVVVSIVAQNGFPMYNAHAPLRQPYVRHSLATLGADSEAVVHCESLSLIAFPRKSLEPPRALHTLIPIPGIRHRHPPIICIV